MTPRVYDIAFMGTSLTSNRVGGWQASFKQWMQKSAAVNVRCYDAGIPGWTSAQGLAYSNRCALLKPRAVVIEYGMNDCPPGAGISVAQFKDNVTAIVGLFKAVSPETDIFLMTMNPVVAPPGSSTNAAALPAYYQGLRDLAVSENVGLIDVAPLWGTPTTGQIPDGVHPTLAAAHAVLIPKLLTTFVPLVTS